MEENSTDQIYGTSAQSEVIGNAAQAEASLRQCC